ncbi:DUF2304 domain-containing protein [Candidatus Woesearchaeota archaeon]|nr:DUF2304 domain-containing protein [Candidatus Woesearchaeota archaeon]
MLLGVQIIGVLFGLFMLYYSFLHYKRKEFRGAEFFLWACLWVLFMGVALFPEILDPLTRSLKFARTMDLFIVIGFIFLITLTIRNYIETRKLRMKMETMVREDAMKHAK